MESTTMIYKRRNTISDYTDLFCAFAIATAPILQHYKGIINGGVTVLSIAVPFAVLKIIRKRRISYASISVIITISLFLLFKVIDHGTSITELGLVIYYLVFVVAYGSGSLKTKSVIEISTMIGCIASICIMAQYFCYYLLHFHLKLVPTSCLLSSANQWVKLAQTGRISVTGKTISFYRPSAFFLEPSHMFVYLFAPLLFVVLSKENTYVNRIKALLLSAGMILSTSGMGIVATILIWLLYLVKRGGTDQKVSIRKLLRPETILVLSCMIILFLVLYYRVEFFQRSVNRIFSSGSDYSNAVTGRVKSGNELIRQMKGVPLFIGFSDHYSDIKFHMTAFNATMYKFGIIGTVLSYLFYIRCLFDLKDKYFWLAFMLIGLSFFTPHTHGTFYMLFFFIYLLDGYRIAEQKTYLKNEKGSAVANVQPGIIIVK